MKLPDAKLFKKIQHALESRRAHADRRQTRIRCRLARWFYRTEGRGV